VGAMSYEEGMKKVMSRILRLVHKHYKEDRQAKIIGEDNEIEIITFNASDLTGDEDIEIVQGSSLPEMKAAQEERLMLLWDKGVFIKKDGAPDTDTFMRLMNMGDATEAYDQKHLDDNRSKMENKFFEGLGDDQKAAQTYMHYIQQKQKADQINQAIQQHPDAQNMQPDHVQQIMEPVPQPPKGAPIVRDFQDHDVHLFNHNSFRKCNEYDELPPELQKLVDDHVAEHEQMAQSQQPMPKELPSESVAFKDLPMAGKIQMAAQMGITLKEDDFQDVNSQQDNQLKQQELQLKSQGQQSDAQIAQAKIQAELQKQQMTNQTAQMNAQVGAATQQSQQQHEQEMARMNAGRQLGSDLIKAEQSHAHNMEHSLVTSVAGHVQGKETSQISHTQQLERDKLSNKNKPQGSGKK
jgi:hypothetical protein